MMKASLRRIGCTCVFAALLLAAGCKKHRKTTSVENTTDYAGNLQALVATKKLPSLKWPNFSDYQGYITQFYDDRNYELAWTRDGKPTAPATAFIQAFQNAGSKGLIPEDYDASLWPGRIAKLAGKPADAISEFDVAMTVNVMRYISDLRIGRVNPSHFNFDINVQTKKYDLAEFVSDHAVDESDVPKLIATVEPDSDQYRATEAALDRYLTLAKQQAEAQAEPLPVVAKTISVGGRYEAAEALTARLKLEGDLAADAAPTTFDQDVSDAIKAYQHRHGLTEDGKLTPQTIKSLNVPLTDRVIQLQNSLERWRWLPEQYINAPLIVNLPEFVLHGYDDQHKPEFTMKVVVGKVVGEHETPVFAHMMKYLVFRPYWNVPTDIAKKELVPHMNARPGYLESKNYEVVNTKGEVQHGYTVKQVAQGGYMVRERPGPKNSLGLVKFMFPNQYDIYLHSTPATELFNRTRRDFSHGCVRVQKPEDLAVWVLQNQKDKDGNEWDLDKVHEAMTAGPDNKTVALKTPIPIVIFYLTGIVEEDGHAHFFDDIYGYDAEMQQVLAKGPPYPIKPEPVVPKTKAGDTV
ncbi:L,D-transpeptidase family protein [Granulicella sp. dw_53]|uniref:L,D-transpeptidase family protein n=1 Tax=Granulicella sp. dw_53 TaxID=2719792 RepID=UPI001BD4A55A|nr:L,D-transpeptidase family protein [Granulicella sp. dw_53]